MWKSLVYWISSDKKADDQVQMPELTLPTSVSNKLEPDFICQVKLIELLKIREVTENWESLSWLCM
jgi:hypothetical protein